MHSHSIALISPLGEHPPTYGVLSSERGSDGNYLPLDTILTSPLDYGIQQCIDYLFELRPKSDVMVSLLSFVMAAIHL